MSAPRTTATLLLACLLGLAGATALAETASTPPWRHAPPEAWVDVAKDVRVDGLKPVEEGSADYIFVDDQVRLSDVTSHYFRSIERLTSQDMVDRAAQISISIDPEHEYVVVHDVRVVRDRQLIDKFEDARRSLLNRESDLENGLIDGRVTLHLLLQDVRVGDVLDFSYTKQRRDPFGERGYHYWFTTQWGSPVRRLRLRILHPADRPLLVRDQSRLPAPTKTRRGDWIDTRWAGRDIAALPGEEHRPSWYFQYPRIEVSEFADWQAVRDWARPLYVVETPDDPRLSTLVADMRKLPDAQARLLGVLRFVQDDIRYTGLEIGAGAYRPTQPGEVLKRRFGDCKDKTLLLVTVLRQLGIEAWPALVHSRHGRGLLERAPGPGAFDHVIAKVRLDGRDYWLDATSSGQGGTLETLAQANYGPSLVLDDSRSGLESMPAREAREANYHVVETFDLRQGRVKPASFTVLTRYMAEEADAMRVRMRSQTVTELGKQYLDYYRKSYPGIRMVRPPKTEDDRAANVYTVTETYEIAEPFEERDDGSWKFYLEAYLVTERAKSPSAGERTAPLAREFPMHVRHEIVAHLGDDWGIEPAERRIEDPAFEYSSATAYRDGTLHLTYDLRNADDHVPAARVSQYRKKIRQVYDDAFYTLTDSEGVESAAASNKPGSSNKAPAIVAAATGPSNILIAVLVAGLASGTFVGRWLLRRRWAPTAGDGPSGISGWLMLPAFVTLLLPLFALVAIAVLLHDYGSAASFSALSWQQQALRGAQAFITGEMLLVAAFGSWALWRGIATFPLLFLALMSEVVLLALVEIGVRWRAGEFLLSHVDPLVAPLSFVALAAIGSWYVWRSARVRATFAMRETR